MNLLSVAVFTAVNSSFKSVGVNTKDIKEYSIIIDTKNRCIKDIFAIRSSGIKESLYSVYEKEFDKEELFKKYDELQNKLQKNNIVLGDYADLHITTKKVYIITKIDNELKIHNL